MNIPSERELDHVALCHAADNAEQHITEGALLDVALTLRKMQGDRCMHHLAAFSKPTRDRILRLLASSAVNNAAIDAHR